MKGLSRCKVKKKENTMLFSADLLNKVSQSKPQPHSSLFTALYEGDVNDAAEETRWSNTLLGRCALSKTTLWRVWFQSGSVFPMCKSPHRGVVLLACLIQGGLKGLTPFRVTSWPFTTEARLQLGWHLGALHTHIASTCLCWVTVS